MANKGTVNVTKKPGAFRSVLVNWEKLGKSLRESGIFDADEKVGGFTLTDHGLQVRTET